MAALLSVAGVLTNPAPASASPFPSPGNVTLTPGRRLIRVAWTAPSNPGNQALTYTATASTTEACTVNSPTLTCDISGVAANTPITVTVKACPANPADCSPATAPAGPVKAGPPAAPPAPTVTFVDPNKMHLTWTDNDAGAGIGSYKVTPAPADGLTGTCTALVAFAAKACDYETLTSDTSYTFKLTAIGVSNGTGTTGTSSAGTASAAKVAGLPHKMSAPTVTRDSDTAVTVSFAKPSGGQALAGYTVTGTSNNGGAPVTCNAPADATTCPFTGLNSAKSYTFTVVAHGESAAAGDSPASDASASITPGMPDVPATPTVELGAQAGEVTVVWDAPTGGGTVASYTVTAQAIDGGTPLADCHPLTGTTRCPFTGLQNGRKYKFQVTATNPAGSQTSAWSDPVISETPAQPDAPTVTLGDAPGKVTLKWPAATTGGPVVYYAVTAVPASGDNTGDQSPGCGFDVTTPGCEITGLSTDMSYTFVVTAVGDLGSVDSDESAPVVPNKPGEPTAATVALDGPTGATVTWDPPAPGPGAGAVESYQVTVTASVEDAELPEPCTVAPTDDLTCSFADLNPNWQYTFTVSAINPSGSTDKAATATVPDIPSAPRAVQLTLGANPGTVSLSWTEPADGDAAWYRITATAPNDEYVACAGADTTCDLIDLDPAQPWTFTVRSMNTLGGTDAAPTAAVIPAAPGVPTAVKAAVTDDGEVTVTWAKPAGGGPVDHYVVIPDPGGDCLDVAAGDTGECTVTGLDASPHAFTVTAVNNIDSTPAAPTGQVVAAAAGTPTDVHVGLDEPPGTVVITWSPGLGGTPTTYSVTGQDADGGPIPDTCASIAPPTTTCTLTGLSTDTSYTFVVHANNDLGPANSGPTDPIVPDQPGAPDDVAVSLVADEIGQAKVTWDDPTSGGGDVDKYVVTATANGEPAPDGCANLAADEHECDLTDLDPAKTYVFTVSAVNDAGSSPATTDPIIPDQPGAPKNVHVTVEQMPGTVTVTWDPPSGGVPTSYEVTADSPGAFEPPPCTREATAERSCTFEGLTPSASYAFVVSAGNLAGTSEAPPTVPVVPNRPNPTGPPYGVVTAADTVRLIWSAPPPFGGGPIAGYTVTAYAKDAPDVPITREACTAVAEPTCDFGGLDETKFYVFTVTVNGPGGSTSFESQPSEEISTAPPAPPAAPTVTAAGRNAVRVTWDKPETGGPVLSWSVVSNPALTTPDSCSGTQNLTCIFGGLTSGTSYTFGLIAYGTADREAPGAFSVPIVPGPPDTPAKPAVKATGTATEVVVSWTAPDPGAGIAGYRVVSAPGGADCAQTAGADATSCVVGGLDPGTRYTFRVQALGVTGTGDSAYSPSSEAIVPQAPGRPSSIDVVASDQQIAVSWTAPDQVDRVAHYRATASPGDAYCETATNTDTECVITGLTNLTSYTVTVTAVGTTGLGDATSRPSARVRPTAGAPGSPTAVQAVGGDTTATISWTAPANAGDGIVRYTASTVDGKVTRSCTTPNGTTTSCTLTGLTNSTTYQVTVVSIGRAASGYSAPSAAVAVTPRTPPGVPKSVTATGGAKSIVVNWVSGGAGDGLSGFTATATGGTAPLTCTGLATATTCTISAVTPGVYTVSVVANGTQTGIKSAASAGVDVTALLALAPAPPSTLPTTTLVLTTSATSAKAGGTVTVSGNGYAPYTQVVVGLYPGAGKLGTAVTNANGEFSVAVTIPANTTLGAKTLLVGGQPPTGTALRYLKAAFTVSST